MLKLSVNEIFLWDQNFGEMIKSFFLEKQDSRVSYEVGKKYLSSWKNRN